METPANDSGTSTLRGVVRRLGNTAGKAAKVRFSQGCATEKERIILGSLQNRLNGVAAMSVFGGERARFGSTAGGRMLKKSERVRTFTRHDLRATIYQCCLTLSRAEARKIFNETFDELADALVRGEPVKLRNFGTFNLRAKRQRTGRNPKTGVEAVISARRVVTFRPSPALLTRINQESADCVPD